MAKTIPFHKFAAEVLEDPASRERIEQYKRAMTVSLRLAELRTTGELTQPRVAEERKTSPVNGTQLEHEEDLYLATLRGYVEALGGRLEVQAVFPDQTVTLIPAAEPGE